MATMGTPLWFVLNLVLATAVPSETDNTTISTQMMTSTQPPLTPTPRPGYFADPNTGQLTICPIGSYCDGNAGRKACPPGSYQDQVGSDECKLCQIGWHQSEEGSIYCVACPAGLYCSEPGAKMAVACPPGTYQPQLAQHFCLPCPAGEYQTEPASRQCDHCPAGHRCVRGSAAPSPCPPGSFQSRRGQPTCAHCPSGTYQLQTASTQQCTVCPHGHQCVSAQRAPQICREGTAAPNGSVACSSCSEGEYQDELGQATCKPCPAGHQCSEAGGVLPVPCIPGTYQPQAAQASCLQCPAGTYTLAVGSEHCVACPPGHWCVEAGQWPRHFRNLAPGICIAGKFQNARYNCEWCPAGTYQPNSGATECLQCQPGHKCAAKSVAQSPCGPGTFQLERSADRCVQCPTGSYCSLEANVSPSPCPPGTFQDETSQTDCKRCPQNAYQISSAASSCQKCPVGYMCPNPTMEPVKTDDNLQLNITHTDPPSCEPGFESNANKQCVKCAAGFVQRMKGDKKCMPCPSGWFASSATVCKQCSPGTYIERGSNKCLKCSPGYMCIAGADKQIACPPGRFAASGSSKCASCPKGMYNPWTAQSKCLHCPIGHYCTLGVANAISCPKGTYSGRTGQSTCSECPKGSRCSFTGMITPLLCAPGTYQRFARQNVCIPCPEGYYQLNNGANACVACRAGFKCPVKNSPPVQCPQNHYQDLTSMSTCKQCPEDRFQLKIGQDKCHDCPAGFSCELLVKNIRHANTGRQTDNGEHGAGPDTGSGNQNVDNGGKDNAEGYPDDQILFPLPCEPGSYSRQGDGSCRLADPGKYTDEFASDSPKTCRGGEFCRTAGAKKPYPCPNGYAVHCAAEPGCNKCRPSRASGVGQTACQNDEGRPCKQEGSVWGCAKNQGKCVADTVLNTLTSGAWGLISAGMDVQTELANSIDNNDAQAVEQMANVAGQLARENQVRNALPHLVDKTWLLSHANNPHFNKIASAYSGVKAVIKGANCLSDKACQSTIDYTNAAYDGLKTIDSVVGGFGDTGPEKWRKFSRQYKKYTDKIAIDSSLADRLWNKLSSYGRPRGRVMSTLLRKLGQLSKNVFKKIGKKIPLFCNLLETLSPDCRHLLFPADCEGTAAAKRSKRDLATVLESDANNTTGSPHESLRRLEEYTVFMSPVKAWAAANPALFLFWMGSNADCRRDFRAAWQSDDPANMTAMRIDDDELQKIKGQLDGSFIEDFIFGWLEISDAIPVERLAAETPPETQLAAELLTETAQLLRDTFVASSHVAQFHNTTRTSAHVKIYVLTPDLPANFTGHVLTRVTLPSAPPTANSSDQTPAPCHIGDVQRHSTKYGWAVRGVTPLDVPAQNDFAIEQGIYISDMIEDANAVNYYVMSCTF